jgi:hypothetical protein
MSAGREPGPANAMYVTPLPTPPPAGLDGMPRPTAVRTESEQLRDRRRAGDGAEAVGRAAQACTARAIHRAKCERALARTLGKSGQAQASARGGLVCRLGVRFGATSVRQVTDLARRDTGDHRIGRHVAGDDGARSNDRSRANAHAG